MRSAPSASGGGGRRVATYGVFSPPVVSASEGVGGVGRGASIEVVWGVGARGWSGCPLDQVEVREGLANMYARERMEVEQLVVADASGPKKLNSVQVAALKTKVSKGQAKLMTVYDFDVCPPCARSKSTAASSPTPPRSTRPSRRRL